MFHEAVCRTEIIVYIFSWPRQKSREENGHVHLDTQKPGVGAGLLHNMGPVYISAAFPHTRSDRWIYEGFSALEARSIQIWSSPLSPFLPYSPNVSLHSQGHRVCPLYTSSPSNPICSLQVNPFPHYQSLVRDLNSDPCWMLTTACPQSLLRSNDFFLQGTPLSPCHWCIA